MKKLKKNWSHELKRENSHYHENARRQDGRLTHNHWHGRLEMYPLCYQVDAGYVTNLKVTALFEPCHARRYGGISFEIRRSMGGSITSSFKLTIRLDMTCIILRKTRAGFIWWCEMVM